MCSPQCRWLTSYAVKHAGFLVVGFAQYITPTIRLLLGMAALGERVTAHRFVSFGVIWLALVMYSFDLVRRSRSVVRA